MFLRLSLLDLNMNRSATAASADIAEDAFKGKVAAAILIPTFQVVLLKMAIAFQDMPSPESALIDPVEYALLMIGVLGLFGVGLTIVSVVASYTIAGVPGVFAYFFFDFLVAAMLNAVALAAATFFVSIFFFAVVFWVHRRLTRSSRPNRGMYR